MINEKRVPMSRHQLSTLITHNIYVVCGYRGQHQIHLHSDQINLSLISSKETRTPMPFIKKDTRFNVSPSGPGTKVVTRPHITSDTGIKTAAPIIAARKRSSGTHSPLRRLRHFTTTWSEKCPDIGAPTKQTGQIVMNGGGRYKPRTDVSKTYGNKEGADQGFVRYAIFWALGKI